MAITIVQRKAATGSGADPSITPNSAITAGNFVVIVLGSRARLVDITDPSGFARDVSRVIAPGGVNNALETISKIGAGETVFNWTCASAIAWEAEMWELHDDASGVFSLDGSDNNDSGSANTIQCVTGVTPSAFPCIQIVGAFPDGSNGSTEAISDSFTIRDAGTFGRLVTGDRIQNASTTAVNPTCSWTTASAPGIVLANYSAVPAGGGTDQPAIQRYSHIPHSMAHPTYAGRF